MYSSFSTRFAISAHKKNFCSFFLIESAALYPGTVISCEKYYQSTFDFSPKWQIAVSEKNCIIKLNFYVCFCKTFLTSESETRASAVFDNVLTSFFFCIESYFFQLFSDGL